jgi:hypothetical protein
MSVSLPVGDTFIIELTTSKENEEALLTIRSSDGDSQRLILTMEQARELLNTLPTAIGRLAALEAAVKGRRS